MFYCLKAAETTPHKTVTNLKDIEKWVR